MVQNGDCAIYENGGFWGDYHTHTVFSHGKGSMEDSVLKAARIGLRELAITDHGFSHMLYNVRRSDLPQMRAERDKLRVKYPQVRLYLGVEANILSKKGDIDVRDADKPLLDIVVCGYHKMVYSWAWGYFLGNNIGLSGQKTMARNTDAYVRALERNKIDILSHPGNTCKCDVREVARACKRFGTFFELNGKRIDLSDGDIEAAAEEGCTFICDSDAHAPRQIGDFSVPAARLARLGIPPECVANYGKLPAFRRAGTKERGE